MAAEDLEGVDSSVFTAVSRMGSTSSSGGSGSSGAPAVAAGPGAGAAASQQQQPAAAAADGAAAAENPFLRGLSADASADDVGSSGAEDGDEEGVGSSDVFDPASWDEETRKQWDSFVSSSRVSLAARYVACGETAAGVGGRLPQGDGLQGWGLLGSFAFWRGGWRGDAVLGLHAHLPANSHLPACLPACRSTRASCGTAARWMRGCQRCGWTSTGTEQAPKSKGLRRSLTRGTSV